MDCWSVGVCLSLSGSSRAGKPAARKVVALDERSAQTGLKVLGRRHHQSPRGLRALLPPCSHYTWHALSPSARVVTGEPAWGMGYACELAGVTRAAGLPLTRLCMLLPLWCFHRH